ncbi:hypothetical protein P8C59_007554 [Phyllachora maydis]|uniref:Increased loss of mitochondrial DNA protein 1 n=1 Tax=Phyllachora maydis TaxID=1825666 RepID=A0AAD9MEB9_9PEZI|nr:hypothetical protein P8C59_007554 [Phyllachora maydis]
MALISAKTIITFLCLFHVTIGFFFINSPRTIADQAVVWVLGEAMGMPQDRHLGSRSSASAFLGVILAIVGICDLVTLSLPEEFALVHHWGIQAPLRLTISFFLVAYTFLASSSSPVYSDASREHIGSHPSARQPNPSYIPSSWGGDGLKNRVFFAFMFVELIGWFWTWVTLREEREAFMLRKAKRRNSHSI